MLGKVDELATTEHVLFHLLLENVKVIDGPFNGLLGLEKVNEDKRKLEVMVKFLEERLH